MARLFALLALVVALGGPKVEFASPASITIGYDPTMNNLGAVQHIAQAHCAYFFSLAPTQLETEGVARVV